MRISPISRYVPISKKEMDEILIDRIGFKIIEAPNSREWIYEFPIKTRSGIEYPTIIRVYSSVHKDTGITREVSKDAIRVQLINKITGYPIKGYKKIIYRTKNAKSRLVDVIRNMFRESITTKNICPRCASMLRLKNIRGSDRKFFGCSSWHVTGCKGARTA